MASTPAQGSRENIGNRELSQHTSTGGVVDQWEAKLLGHKKGLNDTIANDDTTYDDTMSMSSIISATSYHLSNSTIRDTWTPYDKETRGSMSSLPTYNEAIRTTSNKQDEKKENNTNKKTMKKKIIPVLSDSSDLSASPEDLSLSIESPQHLSLSSRFRMSQNTQKEGGMMNNYLGQKLKNNYSFRDRKEKIEDQTKSDDTNSSHTSPIESDTSQRPPHGTRIVVGRETSPVPSQLQQEGHDKFTGLTRQDLIDTIITLQATVETQGKKVTDLEDYIDTVMVRIMEEHPVLLEKTNFSCKPTK